MTVRPRLDQDALARIRNTINRSVGNISVRTSLDRASLSAVEQQINRTIGRIQVRLELDRNSLARIRAQIAATSFRATLHIDADRSGINGLLNSLTRVQGQLDRTSSSARNMGVVGRNAFRQMGDGSRMLMSTLPLILPIISTLISAVGALGGAFLAAFSTAGLGIAAFGAIAIPLLSRVQAASKSAETGMKSMAAATERVVEARQRLARAVEQAARDQAAAQRRIEDAERSLTSAQNAARRAQEDLNRARADAVEELEDLRLALRGAALSEEQAILDLEEAQLRFNEALAAGTSGLELKQLELDVRQAALAVDETRERYGDLQEESSEWARTGIEGSRGVRDAQDNLAQANEAVRDAERDVADARREADEVARDSARDIAEARRELALAEQQASQQAAANMTKMSAGTRLVKEGLDRLKATYEALIARTEVPVALALNSAFEALEALLRTLDPLIVSTAKGFENIGQMAEDYFGSSHWRDFVDLLSIHMVPLLETMFEIIAYGARGVMNLVRAFLPFTQGLLDDAAEGMKDFAEWTERLAGDPAFQDWLERARDAIGRVISFLWAFIKLIWNIADALAPLGGVILDFLTKVFNGLSKLPPEWLAGIAGGLGAVFTALFLGASLPVAVIVGGLFGIAAGLTNLYENNETFRTSIDNLVSDIKDKFSPHMDQMKEDIETKVKPAFEGMVDQLEKDVMPVLGGFRDKLVDETTPAVGGLADAFTGKLLPQMMEFIEAASPYIAWMIEKVGGELIDSFNAALQIIEGFFIIVGGLFQTGTGILTGDWQKFNDGLKSISEGAWTIILSFFGLSLDEMQTKYDEWDQSIMNKWNTFWGGVITEQDGSQTEVNGKWNDFWDACQAKYDEWDAAIMGKWESFWGKTITEQDGSQTEIKGSWDRFWDSAQQKYDEWDLAITNGWNTFWSDLFATFRDWGERLKTDWDDMWARMQEIIGRAVQGLARAWNQIQEAFRGPINWVIRVVINRGILGSWNTVMGWIGQPGLQVAPVPELVSGSFNAIPGMPNMATGGPIFGGVPNKDSVPAMLMPGEYVLSKRAIQNLGGLGAVDRLHQNARRGATDSAAVGPTTATQTAQALMRSVPWTDEHAHRFAYGGVQPHVARAGQEIERIFGRMPGGIGGVGQRSNASDHPSGHALDFMTLSNKGLGDRVAGHLLANSQRMAVKYLIWQQAINSGSGWRGMEDRGSPTANHFDHVHASFNRQGIAGKVFSAIGGVIARVISWWQKIGPQVTSLFGGIGGDYAGAGNGSVVGNVLKAMGKAAVGKALAAIRTKLENLFTTEDGAGGAGPGSGPVVDQVRAVANKFGWGSGAEWDALSRLIQKESSWNPTAQNPTSTAYGLFQFLDSTWGTVGGAKTSNPGLQAEYGLRYIRQRYGTPGGALAFHNRNNWYDAGGVLPPGATLALNGTGRNEFVNTPPQLQNLFDAGGQAGGEDAIAHLAQLINARAETQDAVTQRLDALIDLLDRRGAGATLNQYIQGNANEAGRSGLLALRLGH